MVRTWGKGACLVWSGGGCGESAAAHTALNCSYRVGGVRLSLPISDSSQTKGVTQCSLQGSDQVLGHPLCHKVGAALGQVAQRGQGNSLLEALEAQSDKATETLTCCWQWLCFKEIWTRHLHRSLPKGFSVALFTLVRLPECCQSFQESLDQSTW